MTKPLSASGPRRSRVILVDDDVLLLRSLARTLRREFDVATAVEAADADAVAKVVDDVYAVPSATRIPMSGEPRTPKGRDRSLPRDARQAGLEGGVVLGARGPRNEVTAT